MRILAKFNTHKENSHHRKKCLRSTNVICVFKIVCVFVELKLVILVSSMLYLKLWNNSNLQRFHIRSTESMCRGSLKIRFACSTSFRNFNTLKLFGNKTKLRMLESRNWIAHFTVTVGNEAGVDLVLIQPFFLYHVNQVVVMLTSVFKQNFH